MDEKDRVAMGRVFASHLVELNDWPEGSPSPETMDDLLTGIFRGEISDRRLRWLVRILRKRKKVQAVEEEKIAISVE